MIALRLLFSPTHCHCYFRAMSLHTVISPTLNSFILYVRGTSWEILCCIRLPPNADGHRSILPVIKVVGFDGIPYVSSIYLPPYNYRTAIVQRMTHESRAVGPSRTVILGGPLAPFRMPHETVDPTPSNPPHTQPHTPAGPSTDAESTSGLV